MSVRARAAAAAWLAMVGCDAERTPAGDAAPSAPSHQSRVIPVATSREPAPHNLAQWRGGYPIPGDHLGHGAEDLVGLMGDVMAQHGRLVAIDGRSFAVAWSVPTDRSHSVPFAVAGRLVAWTDADSVVRVHEAATGKERRRVQLNDDVASFCPHPERPGWLLAVGSHDTRFAIDPATGAVANDAGQAPCVDRSASYLWQPQCRAQATFSCCPRAVSTSSAIRSYRCST